MKIYCLIPIKHNSSRVPGKNYRDMNGKPLFYWIINTVLNSNYVDKVIIDTDSPTIKELVPLHFSNQMDRIILYDRPVELHGGDVATNKLFMNVIEALNLDADLYLQTHTTNPLLKTETIDDAIEKFNASDKDSLFSVNTWHTRLYDKNGKDINHNRKVLIPTQDLDPIYEENSCIYLFTKESLFKFGARIGDNAMLYPTDPIESQDIDWEHNFVLTETLMKMF